MNLFIYEFECIIRHCSFNDTVVFCKYACQLRNVDVNNTWTKYSFIMIIITSTDENMGQQNVYYHCKKELNILISKFLARNIDMQCSSGW